MGFDLYSTGNHKSQKGEYFRNNVWWWRPLWDWTYEQCQDILSDKEYERGTYNDCYAIDGERANKIADRLLDRLDDARAYRIAMENDHKPKEEYNKLLTEAAEIFYNKIVNKQNGKITCPGDLKELDKDAYDRWSALMFDMQYRETSYPFHENNVKEFAEFCKESGGFTIG